MSLLRIHLPPDWPDAAPATTLPWCRIGTRGECIDAGHAPLAGLPIAEACELVSPSELVLLTTAMLPRGGRQKLRQLLPYAIEDRLGGEPETVHSEGTASATLVTVPPPPPPLAAVSHESPSQT